MGYGGGGMGGWVGGVGGPCVTLSIGGFCPGPWTVIRLFFTTRFGVDPLLKVRHAAVLTPPFLFLHRRRVVVVQTFRIHTALTFAPPPPPVLPSCKRSPAAGDASKLFPRL